MLSEDQELSLRSAVKLLRMVVQQTDLPGDRKLKADEALRQLMVTICGTAELPDSAEYRRRPAA
ncbi:MAG: hypothetical protein HY690_12385 [Chloroflexi bacterium]|nr:hypothetical protein [Chloroflexota bacterium]